MLHDVVGRWARDRPRSIALTESGRHVTYAELAEDVDCWATYLLRAGVVPGDRVALLARPSTAAITVYLATASVGAVFQGLNPGYTARELAHVLSDARPALVLDAVAADALRAVCDRTELRLVGLDAVQRDKPVAAELAAVRARLTPRDPALLVYTSGSTGAPKGALIPHDALVYAGDVHARRWPEAQTTLCPFPINHVASLSDIFGTALAAGGRTVVLPSFEPATALAALQDEQVTLWGFIPAAALLMTQLPQWRDADLRHIRHAVWGGGAASHRLLAALRDKGLRPVGCYGSTETVGNVCFTDPDDPDDELVRSIGRPDPAYEIRLDPATCELLVRSPHPFLGYLNQPDASAAAFTDGWLRTGDVATALADGSLSLVGRTREMFKSGGYNVYPREIELVFEQLPDVHMAAVLPEPDELYGEVGHAYLVAPGADTRQLLAEVRQLLAGYKVPKRLTLVDELPLLSVGKVDKLALRGTLS